MHTHTHAYAQVMLPSGRKVRLPAKDYTRIHMHTHTHAYAQVMLPSGRKVRLPAKDVRSRAGEAHPVASAVSEARGRVTRYDARASLTIQRRMHTRVPHVRMHVHTHGQVQCARLADDPALCTLQARTLGS